MRYWLGLWLAFGTTAIFADTLSIPIGQQGDSHAALPYPGQLRSEVLNRFGLPDMEHPAVGKPPITRWDYRDFSVYFENNRVIDAVRDHQPSNRRETP
ncbi:phosphodiesterase [Pseudomonas asuensis]|uniref:Phosphodiesterase n=1 Tax=Pseudomonas asuensis TaxID=1825787 RepID=A0ABQ2H2G4_9PSED|nr:phosphodiesterase [Pseudomonas asuensis]GGM24520.1 hypothetical protein GCM10009425_39200 [Pseudomonas asuensis]